MVPFTLGRGSVLLAWRLLDIQDLDFKIERFASEGVVEVQDHRGILHLSHSATDHLTVCASTLDDGPR